MMKRLQVALFVLAAAPALAGVVNQGPTLPATCTVGERFQLTVTPFGIHQCESTDTWCAEGVGSGGPGGGAPTGAQYWVGAADAGLSAEKNLGALATGLVVNTAGTPSVYAGTSCTNQFPRSLDASGAATCASVGAADIATDGVSADELDVAGVETELEGVLDLPDLQGVLTVAKGGAGAAPGGGDQVLVSDSTSAATWRTVPDCDTAASSKLLYDQATNAWSCGTDQTGGGGSFPTGKLTAPVAVAVNASYATVFTVTPGTSTTNLLRFSIYHTASATTVGVQFRVSSADAGNVGSCHFSAYGVSGTASSATAVEQDTIAIGSAPADTGAAAAFSTTLNRVDVDCQFASDGTPGNVLLEAQLETGTTSINVLAGSHYVLVTTS